MFAKYIRYRDKYVCQRCGKQYQPETAKSSYQCAHIESRRKQSTTWDEDNAFGMCRGCHKFLDTYHSSKRDFYIEKKGKKKYDELLKRAREIKKWKKSEVDELVEHYSSKLEKLT